MSPWEKFSELAAIELGKPAATKLMLRLQSEMPGTAIRIPSVKRGEPSKDQVLDALEDAGGDVRQAALTLGCKVATVFRLANSPDPRWTPPAPPGGVSSM